MCPAEEYVNDYSSEFDFFHLSVIILDVSLSMVRKYLSELIIVVWERLSLFDLYLIVNDSLVYHISIFQ